MKKLYKSLATACAAIALSQSAIFASEPAPAETAVPAAAVTDADPALWVVKDADTTIYLFGTVHVLKPGLSWFDEAVKTAFDASDELMLEMVLPEDQAVMAQVMMPLAIDQTGKTIPSRLAPEALQAYQAAMVGVGMPANQFDPFEPWFPAMLLSTLPLQKLGYDPEQGSEKLLTQSAKDSAKPISGLETFEQQIGFFDNLPEATQVTFLNTVVRDIDKLGPTLDLMVGQWAAGDHVSLARTMNESMAESPEVAQTLLYDRNARWADQLKARMDQPGTVFVAVGAGHLAGEKSLQDYLKDQGITAERIEY